jgi:oligopeptide transport system substrate-binding protein
MNMLGKTLRAAMLSTAILTIAGMGAGLAQEMVYNRGNDTDPTTLDHAKTSTVAESNLMLDLYEGLVTYGVDASVVPGAATP